MRAFAFGVSADAEQKKNMLSVRFCSNEEQKEGYADATEALENPLAPIDSSKCVFCMLSVLQGVPARTIIIYI